MKTGDELVAPFAEGVAATFREMAGAEVMLRAAVVSAGDEAFAAVTMLLPLTTAAGPGRLILSFPEVTAVALARQVLKEEVDSGMVCDCIGEVANVVAGQAKTLLLGTPSHFTLATPMSVRAGDAGVSAGWQVLQFESELGAFTVYVDLPS